MNMRLDPGPFDLIVSGNKNLEIRLFDEKRQRLNLGDIITFSKRPELIERVDTLVVALLRYRTIEELVDDIPMEKFGYLHDYDKAEFVKWCYSRYSAEEVKKYGILGIKIEI